MTSSIIPLFSSSSSLLQGGIFTVEKAGEKQKSGYKKGPVSLCDLANDEGLKDITLVESNFVSFMAAYKNMEAIGTQLKFGLKLTVCEDMEAKDEDSFKTESKIIIFMGADTAYKHLIKIYSVASTKGFYYIPRIDWKTLKSMWADDLVLALPFYSSFLAKNTLTFSSIAPDLPVNPIPLVESNLLPFDYLIKDAVNKYAHANNLHTQLSKSIYYRNRSDAKSWMIWRCILSRTTWDKPNLNHCTSKEFCYESWKGSNI
jgi:DNA polymerase III alpha subunit